MNSKISRLIETSKEVLQDCCLENGAIVAINSDKEYFPNNVFFYRYVWPRDAAFTLVALDILEIKGIHEKYYKWLNERAEDFAKTGFLFQNYHTHGPKHWMNLQPDSNGLTLWAIYNHVSVSSPDEAMVTKLAEGLSEMWSEDIFSRNTQELWEERTAYTDLNEMHLYSASIAYRGLKCADKMFPNKKWQAVAEKIKTSVLNSYDSELNFFPRTKSDIKSDVNYSVDSSLFSLIYPSMIIDPTDERMINTVNEIETKLQRNGGLRRNQFDVYDGMIGNNLLLKKGAGCWPILNFWASIYYSLKGDEEKAREYYNWVIDRVDDYIPEQIFENNIQVSISPLAWSHSMFIIASKHLNII
jgi:glucoamylase